MNGSAGTLLLLNDEEQPNAPTQLIRYQELKSLNFDVRSHFGNLVH